VLSRRRRARVAVIAVGAAALLGLVVHGLAGGSGSPGGGGGSDAGHEVVLAPVQAKARHVVTERARARKLLAEAVRSGPRNDGEVEVAVMLDGWTDPLVAASKGGSPRRWMRAWSMSKVFTAVALLRGLGWGDRAGTPLTPEVEQAVERALTRSENCRQRRVVLELQRVSGGTPAGARSAVRRVLERAGASGAGVATQVQAPEPLCAEYLASLSELPDPQAQTLLLGTSTWTVGDAARFTHALGAGEFGHAISRYLLALMRRPKERSSEAKPIDYTASLSWGAGAAFGASPVAYKAGWGGTQQGAFLAGQIVVVHLPDGSEAGVSVAFHPRLQPLRDDPGLTRAPAAVAEALRPLARGLPALRG
jgi:hypothetical protein